MKIYPGLSMIMKHSKGQLDVRKQNESGLIVSVSLILISIIFLIALWRSF